MKNWWRVEERTRNESHAPEDRFRRRCDGKRFVFTKSNNNSSAPSRVYFRVSFCKWKTNFPPKSCLRLYRNTVLRFLLKQKQSRRGEKRKEKKSLRSNREVFRCFSMRLVEWWELGARGVAGWATVQWEFGGKKPRQSWRFSTKKTCKARHQSKTLDNNELC